MEQCGICLDNLIDQEIGIPEHCEHAFCFTCLVDWSKEENSCPNDRRKFQFILKKHFFASRRSHAKVDIKNTQLEILLEDEDILRCDACDDQDQEYHPLLTCNGCHKSYHEICLNSFDISEWICPACEYNNDERPELVHNSSTVKPARTRTIHSDLPEHSETIRAAKPLRRLQQITSRNVTQRTAPLIIRNTPSSSSTVRSVITPNEAARRIAASGLPIVSSPRTTALISQAQNMAELHRKRKRVARLPSRIPINRLPRIQRRTDAPIRPRPKSITPKFKSRTNASFLDKLLHSQNQLYSLENIRMQGAQIELS